MNSENWVFTPAERVWLSPASVYTRGLVEFKVANGFECVEVPRYYVPLTWLGSIALKAGVHQRVVHKMPAWSVEAAAKVRKGWNMFKFRRAQAS